MQLGSTPCVLTAKHTGRRNITNNICNSDREMLRVQSMVTSKSSVESVSMRPSRSRCVHVRTIRLYPYGSNLGEVLHCSVAVRQFKHRSDSEPAHGQDARLCRANK